MALVFEKIRIVGQLVNPCPVVPRTQVASLTAELSAERGVSEETRKQVLAARAEASHQQTQVRV